MICGVQTYIIHTHTHGVYGSPDHQQDDLTGQRRAAAGGSEQRRRWCQSSHRRGSRCAAGLSQFGAVQKTNKRFKGELQQHWLDFGFGPLGFKFEGFRVAILRFQ